MEGFLLSQLAYRGVELLYRRNLPKEENKVKVYDESGATSKRKSFFDKYMNKGSYHWSVLSHNPFSRNLINLGRYQVTLHLLVEAAYGLKGKKVLDMGCGDGVLSYLIAQTGGSVSGIDLCKFAVEYAKKKATRRQAHIDFSIQDVCGTSFPDGVFDAVVSNEVIEHLIKPERMLSEIKRVLRPGGVAVLSTPIRVSKEPLDQYHMHEWFREDFCDMIESVFPESKYRVSHPLALTDIWYRSRSGRILLQAISPFFNLMCRESPAGLFRQQYAVMHNSIS